MRIVHGTQLATLKPGTIIQSYEPTVFGPLMRLERVYENDFLYVDLSEPGIDTEGQVLYLQTPGDSGRWGGDDLSRQHFLVWDTPDVERLIALLRGEPHDSENTCPAFP